MDKKKPPQTFICGGSYDKMELKFSLAGIIICFFP